MFVFKDPERTEEMCVIAWDHCLNRHLGVSRTLCSMGQQQMNTYSSRVFDVRVLSNLKICPVDSTDQNPVARVEIWAYGKGEDATYYVNLGATHLAEAPRAGIFDATFRIDHDVLVDPFEAIITIEPWLNYIFERCKDKNIGAEGFVEEMLAKRCPPTGFRLESPPIASDYRPLSFNGRRIPPLPSNVKEMAEPEAPKDNAPSRISQLPVGQAFDDTKCKDLALTLTQDMVDYLVKIAHRHHITTGELLSRLVKTSSISQLNRLAEQDPD